MNTDKSHKRKRKVEDYEIISDDSESEEEFDFVNVDLEQVSSADDTKQIIKGPNLDLSISLDSQNRGSPRRQHRTAAIEKKIRLEIHKLHLLCLVSHVSLRNKWCSDNDVQSVLAVVKSRFKGNLHPKTTSAQIQRTRVLLEGLDALSDLWSKVFKVTKPGLRKSKWYTDEDMPKVIENGAQTGYSIQKEDLLQAAIHLRGDRDIGALLFVALLRSLHVPARLVCSLQPLGLSVAKTNLANLDEDLTSRATPNKSRAVAKGKSPQAKAPKFPKAIMATVKPVSIARPKPVVKLATPVSDCAYPVYWAEVFDPAAQKWYPVDPLTTGSVNKPTQFEPPQSETENTLSYVIGFEHDGSARDVTHRYTRQFNAKIRRLRLDSIPTEFKWWQRLMRLYAPRRKLDYHRIEDAEFSRRALDEGIPANVTDLKNHPLFVLERHLRKDEIIQPLRECGTIRIGKTQPPVVEKVYPRKHLLKLRSSLAWYMRGRQIRVGEQPLKTVPKKTSGRLSRAGSHDGTLGQPDFLDETPQEESLFAESQTELFIPPPVVDGLVPKNAYGNIDLFVPSMAPPGSVHIPERDAEATARILGIDYAAAVTGFDHANRQTVPVVKGVVVAQEFRDGMLAVQTGLRDAAAEADDQARTLAALKRWSHFLKSLRIRSHVQSRYGELAADTADNDGLETYDEQDYNDDDDEEEAGARDSGGGFM